MVVTLKSNPSTGYGWGVEAVDKEIIDRIGEVEFKTDSKLIGAPGREILRFKALKQGTADLRLVYRRAWEKNVKSVKSFSIKIAVQ